MEKPQYIAMIAAAIVVSSCAKELSENTVDPTIEIEFVADAGATKTSLSEGHDVFWSMSDELSFFDGTDNRKLTAKSVSGTSAVFTGQVAQGCTDFLAVYPYNGFASADVKVSTVTTEIPATQIAVEDSFGDDCNIAISKGTADQMSGKKTYSTFYNACQLIRFTIPSYLSNVTEVTIASQDNKAIAGMATFDFSGGEPVLSSVSGASKVTLTGNFYSGSSYYAVVAPVSFNGITVTMTSNGILYTKQSSVQFTGSRNKPFDIGEINFPAQATCTISHYNDASGNLAGSYAVVSLAGVADNVTAWSADLYKGETKVRSISVSGGLSSGKTMTAVEGWPYLPKGTYTLKNVKYVRNGKNVKCEDVAVASPAPMFSCNFSLKGYTSYDVYKNNKNNAYGKSGASAANELDGSTVYGIGMSFTGISSDLMNNSNYSKMLICSYDGVQVAFGTSGTSLNAGNKTGQSWAVHSVGASVTFDDRTQTSSSFNEIYVTGLPFVEPFNNVDAWDITGNTTKDGIDGFKLGGGTGEANATLTSKFQLPALTNVKVSSDYYLYSRYWLGKYLKTTYMVKVGGTTFITRESENSKNEEKYTDSVTGSISGSAELKIESSNTETGPYVRIKNLSVLYN